MDTRKLTVETYGCSCSHGVEYGLAVKQLHRDAPEGEEYAGNDCEANFITRCRHEETTPSSDAEVWDLNQERTMLTALVRRWNAFPALVEALADMVSAAKNVEGMMDGDRDKQEAWAEELERLYVALDAAKDILNNRTHETHNDQG